MERSERKAGLAYAIYSGLSCVYGLAKYFYVYAEVDRTKLDTVESIVRRVLAESVTQKREFEGLEEEISRNAFEVVVGEQSADYEAEIWNKIADGEPVKGVETHAKKRLEIIEGLTVKDVENVRKQFIRPELFSRVAIIGRKAA